MIDKYNKYYFIKSAYLNNVAQQQTLLLLNELITMDFYIVL